MTDPSQALAFLKALDEGATVKKWALRSCDGTLGPKGWYVVEEDGIDLSMCALAPPENAALIAHVRNVLPQLIGVLEHAEALVAHHESEKEWSIYRVRARDALTALTEAIAREQEKG